MQCCFRQWVDYRKNNLSDDLIFLSASFKGVKSKAKIIKSDVVRLKAEKEKNQPTKIKTSGSTFKNPINQTEKKVWQLIKESGCEKFSVGDAKISEKHCNFFINNGNAKTSDIEALIAKVKNQVKSKTGINLELEIKIIGDEK